MTSKEMSDELVKILMSFKISEIPRDQERRGGTRMPTGNS